MIYPDIKDFKELAEKNSFVQVMMDIPSIMFNPIDLFRDLYDGGFCYLLESAENDKKWGRFSYIGRKPLKIIKGSGTHTTVFDSDGNKKEYEGKILDTVKSTMNEINIFAPKGMENFSGGAVGYIGYDVIRNYEDLKNINCDDLNMPEVYLMIAGELIVFDHIEKNIKVIINQRTDDNYEICYLDALKKLNKYCGEILNSQKSAGKISDAYISHDFSKCSEYKSNMDKEEYMKNVESAKKYIMNGDIFQVVLSRRLETEYNADPFDAYVELRKINPSPYMYYFDFKDFQIAGSSPELLVKVSGDTVSTCPIAGSRGRGTNENEDAENEESLISDEKEKAEHLMLVDLARNDIGRISKFGTVEVSNFMHVRKYSHIMHMVTDVSGKIDEKINMYDVLASCLPAGTVSGAPKVRAMEIIDELENRKRGVYAGAIGYFGFDGMMDMCIAIRTAVIKDGKAYIQAGAGIVADSVPEREYNETLQKAGALIDTMKKANERGIYNDCNDR